MTPNPKPPSLAIARILALIAASIPMAYALWLVRYGLPMTPERHTSMGSPPDVAGFFELTFRIVACVLWTPPLAVAAVGVWRRRTWGTIFLAALCGVELMAIAVSARTTLRSGHVSLAPIQATLGAFLAICAAVCVIATVRLRRFDRQVEHPLIPYARRADEPELEVVDDLFLDDPDPETATPIEGNRDGDD